MAAECLAGMALRALQGPDHEKNPQQSGCAGKECVSQRPS